MSTTRDFTKGKIFEPLFKFALPVLAAMLLQAMYGAVDLLIVGKFGVTADVSAVSIGSQLTHSITTVIIGLSMGTTVLLGQYLGEGKQERAGDVIGGAIILFAIVSLILTISIPLLSPLLADAFFTPPEAYDKTISYIRICMFGAVFIVAYNLLGSVLRGLGDSKTPLLSVGIACVINIIGDYILVAIFHMGSAGAAIATVAAQAISVVICFVIIAKRGFPFPFGGENIYFNKSVIGNTLKLGAPLALQDFLVSVSFCVILAIVNRLGVVASAGIGVGQKIVGFIMLIPTSMSQSLSAFVAQNFGAGKDDRSCRALYYSIGVSLAVSVVVFYVAFFHGDMLASLFANDPEVIAVSGDYLKAYGIDCLLTSFMFCFNGYFNGCGRTKFVMFHGIFSAFCIRIPVSYIMSLQVPVSFFHIGLATPCATIVQCVLCTIYFIVMHRKSKTPR